MSEELRPTVTALQLASSLRLVSSPARRSKFGLAVTITGHLNTTFSLGQLALVVTLTWGLLRGLLPLGIHPGDIIYRDIIFWFGILFIISLTVELARTPDLDWALWECDALQESTLHIMKFFRDLNIIQVFTTCAYFAVATWIMGVPIWVIVAFGVCLVVRLVLIAEITVYVKQLEEARVEISFMV